MIKSINSSSRYISVMGGQATSSLAKNFSSNTVMTGQMIYDFNDQQMKVYDGQYWQTIPTGYATVELTYDAESLLDWARQKRNEDLETARLAKDNPTIQDLVEQIKLKQDQLKMVVTLLNSPGNEPKPSMVP